MRRIIIGIMLVAVWAGAASAAGRWRGDLNGDDRVDMADMVTLANAIKAGSTDKELDMNASGKVDDYDMDALANIILSGQLTENSGLNVGIGGWDDSGEDFGGTVNAPAYPGTRSAESTRFYIGNPRENGGRYSIDFGIEEADVTATAFLFNIRLPREISFEENNIVTLDGAALDGHRLYGKPRITQQDEWSPRTLRFIVFSGDLKPLKITRGVLGQLHYACDADWTMDYSFEDCQIVSAGSNSVVTPEVSGNWIYWKPVAVSSIWFDIQDMEMRRGDQQWIYANIDPWEATDRSLTWTSSDAGVVTVAPESGNPQSAVLKALKAGNATISATASNGLTATLKICVLPTLIEYIVIEGMPEGEIAVGDKFRLTAKVYPEDATDITINWSSDNERVAAVDADGNVEILTEGSTVIRATANDGSGCEALCYIDAVVGVEMLIDAGKPFRVHDINGRLIMKDADRTLLPTLPKGIYILVQGNASTKFIH